MYLLDTNVVSELRKQSKADRRVAAWLGSTPSPLLFISVVTIAEIEMGVLGLERRDRAQAKRFRLWAEKVKAEFERRCCDIDRDVAEAFARLQTPDRRPERDCWIAATAMVRGLTVVTRNSADFAAMNVAQLNPWEA